MTMEVNQYIPPLRKIAVRQLDRYDKRKNSE